MADYKVVLVTGCSSGIGNALVRDLQDRGGFKIYATARRFESLSALEGVKKLELDVIDDASCTKAVDTILQREGHIDILIVSRAVSFRFVSEKDVLN